MDEQNNFRIELNIEELVLHGIAPGDRHRVAGALERELTRLFTEQGIPSSFQNGFELPQLDAGSFQLLPATSPNAVGAQIAQSVYRSLSR